MKIKLIAAGICAAMLLSGCAESTDKSDSAADNAGEIQTDAESGGTEAASSESDTDAEDSPTDSENKNILYGEVYEVIGNLLVLDIIEMPEGIMSSDGSMRRSGLNMEDMSEEEKQAMRERMQESGMSEEDMQAIQNFAFNAEDMSEEDIQAMQERFQNRSGGDAGGGFQIPGGASFQIGDGDSFQIPEGATFQFGGNGKNETAAKRILNYTGEQREVIIPVGIPITSYSFANGELTEAEVDIKTVKSGSLIMISYNEDGNVEKAQVIS